MLAVPLVLAGCGGSTQPGNNNGEGKPGASAPAPPEAGSTPDAQAKIIPVALAARLQQSFLDATVQEPPGDEQRPPDMTRAGKSVGKLYQAIVGDKGQGGLWEQVKFLSPAGKKLHYTATIKTGLGTMVMELWPEVAPNHVRNFVALARAGYYDGLSFDRAVNQQSVLSAADRIQFVEAGCPLATGEAGYGSIGYWLKAEFDDKVRHEPGTVGAWHGEEVDSAACKFYITLNRAEWLDGQYTVFGKITQGLDVLRKIYESPRSRDFEDRLENSVTIQEVTIHTEER
jgi:cyclophilin family peptidyl-prolyl cis-trans isomerase